MEAATPYRSVHMAREDTVNCSLVVERRVNTIDNTPGKGRVATSLHMPQEDSAKDPMAVENSAMAVDNTF